VILYHDLLIISLFSINTDSTSSLTIRVIPNTIRASTDLQINNQLRQLHQGLASICPRIH
jgi:hypothetical protein